MNWCRNLVGGDCLKPHVKSTVWLLTDIFNYSFFFNNNVEESLLMISCLTGQMTLNEYVQIVIGGKGWERKSIFWFNTIVLILVL